MMSLKNYSSFEQLKEALKKKMHNNQDMDEIRKQLQYIDKYFESKINENTVTVSTKKI